MSATSTYHAKVFRTGGSLAIRLPKACHIAQVGDEVTVRRDGKRLVIEAGRFPQAFLDSLGSMAGEEVPVMPRDRRSRLADRSPF